MKMSGYSREVFVEWLHLKSGKVQRAHLLFRRIVVAIRVQHLSVATRNLRTNKENIGRVLVAGGKRLHVPAIPVGNLFIQHSANGPRLRRSALGEEERRHNKHDRSKKAENPHWLRLLGNRLRI